MCLLCTEFAGEIHWADHRLIPDTEEYIGKDRSRRRQDRFHRSQIINRVIQYHGLKFHYDSSATISVISDQKGASEVVQNLTDLWIAAERIAGQSIDPLDSRILSFLDQENAG